MLFIMVIAQTQGNHVSIAWESHNSEFIDENGSGMCCVSACVSVCTYTQLLSVQVQSLSSVCATSRLWLLTHCYKQCTHTHTDIHTHHNNLHHYLYNCTNIASVCCMRIFLYNCVHCSTLNNFQQIDQLDVGHCVVRCGCMMHCCCSHFQTHAGAWPRHSHYPSLCKPLVLCVCDESHTSYNWAVS